MANLGRMKSPNGIVYQIFTTSKEADKFAKSHDRGKYVYIPITVYGVCKVK